MTNKNLSKKFYSASPFPHIIIDNFLPINELKKVTKSLINFKKHEDTAMSLDNSTTKKKIIHKYSKSPKIIKTPEKNCYKLKGVEIKQLLKAQNKPTYGNKTVMCERLLK